MIEVLVWVGAFLLITLILGVILWHITDTISDGEMQLNNSIRRDKQQPPSWAAPQFRCPNCSCKWCKFGVKDAPRKRA